MATRVQPMFEFANQSSGAFADAREGRQAAARTRVAS